MSVTRRMYSISISALTVKLLTIEAQLDNDIDKLWIQFENMKRTITWTFLIKIDINIGNKQSLRFFGFCL